MRVLSTTTPNEKLTHIQNVHRGLGTEIICDQGAVFNELQNEIVNI